MKKTIKTMLWLLGLCLLWMAAVSVPAQESSEFVVVVNVANPTAEMERDRLGKFFLKRIKSWDDGVAAAPVDQLPDSAIREAFTREIFDKKVSAIKSYWQRMIFSGKAVPPPELDSDASVLAFVRGDPGGVGYVSASAELGEGVRVLNLVE